MKKKSNKLLSYLIIAIILLLIIPLLAAWLSLFSIERSGSYLGTKYSYFNPNHHPETSTEALEVQNRIVSKLVDQDWESVLSPLTELIVNPVKADQIVKDTLNINLVK